MDRQRLTEHASRLRRVLARYCETSVYIDHLESQLQEAGRHGEAIELLRNMDKLNVLIGEQWQEVEKLMREMLKP